MNNTKIISKKTGRPKNFEREDILEAAVNVFWRKGYDGASMKDLTGAMGINGPSLYAEFGDKLGLYHAAIDKYANNDGCAPLVAFEAELDIYEAVEAFMKAAIDYATDHQSGAKGCFLVSCVSTSSGAVEGIDTLLAQAIKDTDIRLAKRFDFEKKQGVLDENFPSLERARLMFDLRQGHVFRARAGLDSDAMKADIDYRVEIVLGQQS